jgi:DNA-binding MarR family transcriptional regulator/GNAT superfamily N-acetyltransferase
LTKSTNDGGKAHGKQRRRYKRYRGFNRFYTNILGLLDKHILESDFSLTEGRILFELQEIGPSMANTLSQRLNIDKSYLSRILAKFEMNGLIEKEVSGDDSRAYVIRLSEKGTEQFHALSEKSSDQITRLLAPLDDAACREIQAAMADIKKHLTWATSGLLIRPFTQADIDFVISRQILLYETEYGFTSDVWKTYVAEAVQQLADQFDPQRDCMLILERGGVPCGCIAIAHADQTTAQLRFFFVEASLRGLGAGRRLMDTAMAFCREKHYRHVFLWTCDRLDAARYLYAKNGFQITSTHENNEWGAPMTEEQWDLEL